MPCSSAVDRGREERRGAGVCGGKSLLKWAGRNKDRQASCVRPASREHCWALSELVFKGVQSRNRERCKLGDRLPSLPGSPRFRVPGPSVFLQENETVRCTYLNIRQSFMPASPPNTAPSHRLRSEVMWCIFSRTLWYLQKRTLVLPRVAHRRHLLG